MAVTYNQALLSTDADFIKNTRSSCKGKVTKSVEELHLRFEVTRKHETGPVEDALVVKDDDYIAEVKTKFKEGMKEYNSYIVQHCKASPCQIGEGDEEG